MSYGGVGVIFVDGKDGSDHRKITSIYTSAMSISILLLIFGATIVAFWISAICGGGASLILVPLLNFLLPSSVVPFSLTVGTFTSSASRIYIFKKNVRWAIFLWFVPFSIPAVLAGAWLMKFVNPMYLQLFVALFLLANITQLFKSKQQQEKEQKPYPKFVLAIVGFLAGFVSGVTGAIGLLFNRFYLRYGLSKEEIVATRAANEVFLHLIKLVIYILLGLYSDKAIWVGVTVAVASVVSSYTVQFILPYISEFTFKRIGYATMVVSGIFLLVHTSSYVIQHDQFGIGNQRGEMTVSWRQSSFALEFALDDGLEIEQAITYEELPPHLQAKCKEMSSQYDRVLLEKVSKWNTPTSYEFYCYKGETLSKFDFE